MRIRRGFGGRCIGRRVRYWSECAIDAVHGSSIAKGLTKRFVHLDGKGSTKLGKGIN